MKKLLALVVSALFLLGLTSLAFTAEKEKASAKCAKCHKDDKGLDKIVAKKNIKSSADLMKAVKEGPTAKMHAKFTDDDIKATAEELKLK